MDDETPLDKLHELAQEREYLVSKLADVDDYIKDVVANALRLGHSWREIGNALGVNKGWAFRRYNNN